MNTPTQTLLSVRTNVNESFNLTYGNCITFPNALFHSENYTEKDHLFHSQQYIEIVELSLD